jgi:hypothetical protein
MPGLTALGRNPVKKSPVIEKDAQVRPPTIPSLSLYGRLARYQQHAFFTIGKPVAGDLKARRPFKARPASVRVPDVALHLPVTRKIIEPSRSIAHQPPVSSLL